MTLLRPAAPLLDSELRPLALRMLRTFSADPREVASYRTTRHATREFEECGSTAAAHAAEAAPSPAAALPVHAHAYLRDAHTQYGMILICTINIDADVLLSHDGKAYGTTVVQCIRRNEGKLGTIRCLF